MNEIYHSVNEAKRTYVENEANSHLRSFSVVILTLMNNEPFGKRQTSGEGFGRKLLGL